MKQTRIAKVRKIYNPADLEENVKATYTVVCKNDAVTDIVVREAEAKGLSVCLLEGDVEGVTDVEVSDENYWSVGEFKRDFNEVYKNIKEAVKGLK